MSKEHQYVTVSPVTPKGKWLVCSRRIGGRDRLAVFAECRNEQTADAVVDAMNAMQGMVAKLSLPVQSDLDACRHSLASEGRKVVEMRDKYDVERRAHACTRDILFKNETALRIAQNDLRRCQTERDELLKKLTPTPAQV